MQYLTMLKAREDQGQPPAELFEAMGRHIEDMISRGHLVTAGGLLPSSAGATVQVRGGELITTDGPFTEATELVGGYAILEARSLEEVVALAAETLELHRKYWPGWEGCSEIRPIAG